MGHNGTTYYESHVGGIVGQIGIYMGNIVENCNNYGSVTGSYNCVGGVVGTSYRAAIKNCQNEGIITGGRAQTAGIVGRTGYYNTTRKVYTKSTIEDCINKGEVTSTGWGTAGITGSIEYGSEVRKCNNYANVTGTGQSNNYGNVGGIVGNQSVFIYNKVACLVENCNNYGDIKASYYYCGGIVGFHQRGSVKNCTNEGNVTGQRTNTGGISGAVGRYDDSYKTNGTIEGCINKGEVTITGTGATAANAGGIAGSLQNASSIVNCKNEGNVITNGYTSASEKTSRTGGIVGLMASVGANKVINSYNTGNVTAAYKYIGGITGYMYAGAAVIEHCYSKGEIVGPANIGGIVGYKRAGTITESFYLENSVKPTTGSKTELGEERDEATINLFIQALK